MKRRLRVDRLILLILVVLLVCGICIFGYKTFSRSNENSDGQIINPASSSLKLDLMDYSIYQTEEMNFDFAILKIRLQDDEAIQFSLDRLQDQNENKLSNVEKYKTQLEKAGYYLSTIPVDFKLESAEQSAFFNIFVPYEKGLKELTIYNLDDGTFFKVDTSQNIQDLETLYYHTGGNVSDGKTYDINVADPSSANTLYKNGREYSVASTVKIFSFKLIINQISEVGISIEEAEFIPDNSDDVYKALDDGFSTMKLENILGKALNNQDVYGLFFEVYAPDESGITYEGILRLKFSNNDEWVEIHTVLD